LATQPALPSALEQALATSRSLTYAERCAATGKLAELALPEADARLWEMVADPHPTVGLLAVRYLGGRGAPAAERLLALAKAADTPPALRAAVLAGLCPPPQASRERIWELVLTMAASPHWRDRYAALEAASTFKEHRGEFREMLRKAFADPNRTVAARAATLRGGL
jgi:hypothetical protein